MTSDQIAGPLRAIVPVLAALLVGWGLDDQTAGLVAGIVVMLGAALWSYMSNRRATMAKQVAAAPDVKIVVGDNAPTDMKAAAVDPRVKGIVVGKVL